MTSRIDGVKIGMKTRLDIPYARTGKMVNIHRKKTALEVFMFFIIALLSGCGGGGTPSETIVPSTVGTSPL